MAKRQQIQTDTPSGEKGRLPKRIKRTILYSTTKDLLRVIQLWDWPTHTGTYKAIQPNYTTLAGLMRIADPVT